MIDGVMVFCQIDDFIGLFLSEVIEVVVCLVVGKDMCLVIKFVDEKGNDVMIFGIDMLV